MRRTGSVAIQVALGLTVLLGFAAIAVDIGLARHHKHQFELASEAAAHAAAAKLDGTADGLVAARDTALAVAAENLVAGTPVVLDRNDANDPAGDVVLGYWEDGAFVPSTTPMETNSVRVVARRAAMNTLFAWTAFETSTIAVGDYSIAQGGGPAADDCPFPLAIPDCELLNSGDICSGDLVLNNARVDNGAWSRTGYTQANANYIRDALNPSICAGASGIDDVVTLNNGQVTTAFQEMAKAVNTYGVPWNVEEHGTLPAQDPKSRVSPYGKALLGQIVVFDDPDNCVNTQYAGTHPIVGYATIIIYDVVNDGTNKEIKAKKTCYLTDGKGGGGFFGTLVPPNFVR
ncbi:MAG: pilus assembly protein TadG-related protein [Myxococcota bacterium]